MTRFAGMTRFFFDYRDDKQSCVDEEGTELASREEAEQEALEALAAIAADIAGREGSETMQFTVRDQTGPLFIAQLSLRIVPNDSDEGQ
jgi:DNA-binding IclR family transcriptional regulator